MEILAEIAGRARDGMGSPSLLYSRLRNLLADAPTNIWREEMLYSCSSEIAEKARKTKSEVLQVYMKRVHLE